MYVCIVLDSFFDVLQDFVSKRVLVLLTPQLSLHPVAHLSNPLVASALSSSDR
jgi:hypothetical protein